jgi:DNA processing protein
VVYPKSNRRLFGSVAGSGAVVSEYYLGEPPLARRFPARNRIIAGLSDAVVVVEAPEKSGALITARHALEAGREVWPVPGPIGFAECRGSNALLADGARVIWDADLFVETFAPSRIASRRLPVAGNPVSMAVPAELPEREAAALVGVGFEPTEVDAIAGRNGVEMRELLQALALLELKGYIRRDAGGPFARNLGGAS